MGAPASGRHALPDELDPVEHTPDGDMHGAFDLAAGATAALRRADRASLGQECPDLTRATSAIRAAAQTVIDLAGRPGTAAVVMTTSACTTARPSASRWRARNSSDCTRA